MVMSPILWLQETQGEELASYCAQLEQLAALEADLNASRDAIDGKIRSLGSLPGEFLEKHAASSAATLKKDLAKVNKKIAKLDKVNLKASDEFGTFQEEQTRLRKRRKVRSGFAPVGTGLQVV
jgi:chromosome segregation ATPase